MEYYDSVNETLNELTDPGGKIIKRGPTFLKDECETLVELVERNKEVIMSMNKSADMCILKDKVWAKLSRQFNARGFRRSEHHLRKKWENMKKTIRTKTNNLQELDDQDELTQRVVRVLMETPHNTSADNITDIDLSDDIKNESCNENGEDVIPLKYRHMYRTPAFTPQQCIALLQCVKGETKYLFGNNDSPTYLQDRREAWVRIAKMFNKKFPKNRRTVDQLKHKLDNMKRSRVNRPHRSGYNKHSDMFDDIAQRPLKQEREDAMDEESEQVEVLLEAPAELKEMLAANEHNTPVDPPADPLSSVLNGYTYTDSTDGCSVSIKEDPEVVRLKKELLNYQLDTAKMERQRVTAAIEAEAAERSRRNEILDLQLREARLNLATAERRHYPSHHAADTSLQQPGHFPVP